MAVPAFHKAIFNRQIYNVARSKRPAVFGEHPLSNVKISQIMRHQ